MATPERPPVKIGGKRNPAYDEWYRAQKKAPSTIAESTAAMHAAIFQSAAEPEQTTNDDPREPEVAPALEASLPEEVDSDAGSSPAPAFIEITVDRVARNKSFVYGDLNGELVPIRVKKKSGPKLVGKPINVEVTVEAGHTLYTHAP